MYCAQDEVSCIGCKMCVWCASGTFRVEPSYGRSRVYAQWIDSEDKVEVGRPLPGSQSLDSPLQLAKAAVAML